MQLTPMSIICMIHLKLSHFNHIFAPVCGAASFATYTSLVATHIGAGRKDGTVENVVAVWRAGEGNERVESCAVDGG